LATYLATEKLRTIKRNINTVYTKAPLTITKEHSIERTLSTP